MNHHMTSRIKVTRPFETSCVTRLKLLSRTRRKSKVYTSTNGLVGGVFFMPVFHQATFFARRFLLLFSYMLSIGTN